MEKIIYILRRDPAIDFEAYALNLREKLATALHAAGARSLRINLADAAVAPAAGVRQTFSNPPIEALLQVWVNSAIAALRRPIDEAIATHCASFAAYLVTESQPLVNRRHPPAIGERTTGFSQVALLRKPENLGYAEWLDIWHNSHTHVAIETQSNFEYIQNVVVRRLTPDSPPLDAIVEECFPAEAMTDPFAFFDAPGDKAKFERNLGLMMDSVRRFIDLGKIDVVATSQYGMF